MLSVLYTCDEAYAPFAGVSLYSLLSSNKVLDGLRIFIGTYGVSEKSREKLLKIAKAHGRKVVFVDISPFGEEPKALGMPGYRGSQAANMRLFFQRFLPPDTDRVLYLD